MQISSLSFAVNSMEEKSIDVLLTGIHILQGEPALNFPAPLLQGNCSTGRKRDKPDASSLIPRVPAAPEEKDMLPTTE